MGVMEHRSASDVERGVQSKNSEWIAALHGGVCGAVGVVVETRERCSCDRRHMNRVRPSVGRQLSTTEMPMHRVSLRSLLQEILMLSSQWLSWQ